MHGHHPTTRPQTTLFFLNVCPSSPSSPGTRLPHWIPHFWLLGWCNENPLNLLMVDGDCISLKHGANVHAPQPFPNPVGLSKEKRWAKYLRCSMIDASQQPTPKEKKKKTSVVCYICKVGEHKLFSFRVLASESSLFPPLRKGGGEGFRSVQSTYNCKHSVCRVYNQWPPKKKKKLSLPLFLLPVSSP